LVDSTTINKMAPMADINVTPMVDVMLVLLVIFIITAPLFTHAIKLDLPHRAIGSPHRKKPETITLSINAQGAIFWDDSPVDQKALAEPAERRCANRNRCRNCNLRRRQIDPL